MSTILHLAIEKVDQHSAFIRCEGILVSLLLHPLYSRLISHSLERCTGSLYLTTTTTAAVTKQPVSFFPGLLFLHVLQYGEERPCESRMWELFD